MGLTDHSGDALSNVAGWWGPELAVYLPDYRSVYIEIPKVACSSIKMMLAGLLQLEVPDHNPHLAEYPAPPFRRAGTGPFYPGCFTFAFVRNPWDRIVSCYRDKVLLEVEGYTRSSIRPGLADCLAHYDTIQPGMPFDAFVEAVHGIPDEASDFHFRSQHTFVCHPDGEIAVDYLGRYENFTDDLSRVVAKLKLPRQDVPMLQSAPVIADFRNYYSKTSWDLVADRFANDIKLFGYVSDFSTGT